MPQISGPGSDDLFDPHDVDDIRERVVHPIVASLIRPTDLETVLVGFGPHEETWLYGGFDPDPGRQELWVLVRAAGETWQSQIWFPGEPQQVETVMDVAWDLANRLEDWVCERVYWNEQAIATVDIPARRAKG